MNREDLNLTEKSYEAPKPNLWDGRKSPPELGVQYWHQQVKFSDLTKSDPEASKPKIALLGYACDEGVKRNKGRIGAAAGPDEIRKELARLAFHKGSQSITDYGNLVCVDRDLAGCQNSLATVIERLLDSDIFPIVMGGGHDIAYGHFKGIQKGLQKRGLSKIGILNFDAHFDLRPVEKEPNSGTPFNQILTEHPNEVSYFALGIQKAVNTKELFIIAKEKNVKYLFNESCELTNFDVVTLKIDAFLEGVDALYITVDLDGFSSAYAPGVSAPSPLGFAPDFALKVLNHLLESKKVVALDVAEMNPNFDRDRSTAQLAARIIDSFVMNV